ncbi:MAG: carboxypeptidase-like regulatory domain-containing protein [Acidobacteriota bacterium]|nr:carboxypeptidase-like regulatory domain-containing protein [Acidobacteriota bacterium]
MGEPNTKLRVRGFGTAVLAVWVSLMFSAGSWAQSVAGGTIAHNDPPSISAGAANARGAISGTVLDLNGGLVIGAVVTLEEAGTRVEQTTDSTGLFRFSSAAAGPFQVKIAATGFAEWTSRNLTLHAGESYVVPEIELGLDSAVTAIEVNYTRHDIAEDQVRAEEKQRVLGAIPNFYVSYVWDAQPLSRGQKFRLALRTSFDPVSLEFSAGIAGVQQAQNDFSGYGQGMAGYGKRFGASFGDGLISTMMGDAVLPSLLHQDPRYFYKGTGSVRSRALYAMASVAICKGDNGRWQPNYSNVFGNLAGAGISNLYYPSSDRNGVRLTVTTSLLETASGAAGSLLQEFLIKKISRGVPP